MFPTLVNTAVTNGTATATLQVINLPASIRNGDLLLAIVRNAVASTYTWPAGWTELIDASDDGDDDENTIGWRVSDGTDSATFTVTATVTGKFAGYVAQIRGARAVAPTLSTVATGTTAANPDATSVTATGGARDYLYGSVFGMGGEPTVPVTTYPTNYSLGNNTANSGVAGTAATNCIVAGAWRQLNAASDDPGAFTVSGTKGNWSAWAIVFYPGGEPIWDRQSEGQRARVRR
jgi:hypothetical protein